MSLSLETDTWRGGCGHSWRYTVHGWTCPQCEVRDKPFGLSSTENGASGEARVVSDLPAPPPSAGLGLGRFGDPLWAATWKGYEAGAKLGACMPGPVIAADGKPLAPRCDCGQGDECPAGRVASSPRCTAEELRAGWAVANECIAGLENEVAEQRIRANLWRDVVNQLRAQLAARERRLSAAWEHLPDVAAPLPRPFPARALRFGTP